MNQTRRSFLRSSILATAALSLPARIHAAAPGANGDVRIGAIGFRGRGMDNIKGLLGAEGVRLTALCDVDEKVLLSGKEYFSGKGQNVETHKDLRKMLESAEVDAVMIASPNHWHSLAAIWAVQAGKDVYVEKPVSHNVFEGRKLVEAAAKYGKIVQAGTQSRSSAALHAAAKWAAAGNLGKLLYARGTCYKPRQSIGKVTGEQPIPAGVDYDLWCGPAPVKPLMREKLHYDWHWIWDTGNGDLGNQGIHQVDIARWFIGEPALSPSVMSVGGRLGYVDDGETPNTQVIIHRYEKTPLYFEVRGLPKGAGQKGMDQYRGASVGVVIQYENGHLLVPNYTTVAAFDKGGQMVKRWGSFPSPKDVPAPDAEELGKMDNHYVNFISACRSRKAADLKGAIEDGHISSALCHTGNISHLLGKKAEKGAILEQVKADKEATDSIERMIQHLGANNVDLTNDSLTLGVPLKMDPKTEKFIGNPAADRLLTREYRAPFVVPDKV